jgi:dihydroxy-acid dehydratase
MSTAPKDFCEGCTCGRAEGGGLAAPEQYAADARDQRSFTAPLDTTPSEGIEPVVPLRSNMWFNNPEDGESTPCIFGKELIIDMVGCYVERYLNNGLTCTSTLIRLVA